MSEHDDQVAIFEWAKLQEGKYPDLWLLHAIPNAGKRTPRMGAWYKAEGLKPGCLDMHLPVARNLYIGLWIEQKYGRGRVRNNQLEWKDRLETAGHLVCVSWSVEGSIKMLTDYLDGVYHRLLSSTELRRKQEYDALRLAREETEA